MVADAPLVVYAKPESKEGVKGKSHSRGEMEALAKKWEESRKGKKMDFSAFMNKGAVVNGNKK